MLTTILLLVTVAYVPGALIFRLPIANREKRSALAAEERLFWAVMISVIVSTTFAFALAAAGIYSIGALAICNAILAAVLALASLGNLRLGPGASHAGWTAVAPAALVAACAWMYFATPAAEYVLGGRDPGVYMSQGIQIAQRQSLVTPDRTVVELPAEHRDVFFPPPHEDPSYYGLRFMGFHLRNPDTGAVSGQFPQGYPIWIAIAYGLDGVTGARRATGWWAILGVLAVYFATARLAGPLAAFAAAGLLSVHVIQTWYARYPNSEIVTQALMFGALLAHAYAHQDEDAFFGPIAASLLGIALFTRLPVVLGDCRDRVRDHPGTCERRAIEGGISVDARWVDRRRNLLHDSSATLLQQAPGISCCSFGRYTCCIGIGGRRRCLSSPFGHSHTT